MKKIISLVLVLISILGLVSCTQAEQIPSNHQENANNEHLSSTQNTSEQSYDVVLSYANWTEDESIYSNSLNIGGMQTNNLLHLPIYKFDTLNDLEQFKVNFGEILTMDAGWDEVPSFNDATQKYDKVFFEENTLILVYVPANNSTHRFGLSGIGLDDTQCHIHLEETTGAEEVDTAMAGYFLTVALPDRYIAKCRAFDATITIEKTSAYTYEELSEMPANELLDLFIKNGLVINDELKASFTEEELQKLFKENFHLWHTGVSAHSYTAYIDLAEQTKVIYDKIAEPKK